MGQYRVYSRDADGRLFQLHVIEAESDRAAVADAEQYVIDSDVEVWQQSRIIAVLAHKPGGKAK